MDIRSIKMGESWHVRLIGADERRDDNHFAHNCVLLGWAAESSRQEMQTVVHEGVQHDAHLDDAAEPLHRQLQQILRHRHSMNAETL